MGAPNSTSSWLPKFSRIPYCDAVIPYFVPFADVIFPLAARFPLPLSSFLEYELASSLSFAFSFPTHISCFPKTLTRKTSLFFPNIMPHIYFFWRGNARWSIICKLCWPLSKAPSHQTHAHKHHRIFLSFLPPPNTHTQSLSQPFPPKHTKYAHLSSPPLLTRYSLLPP